MARNALVAVSIALLSLGAATATQAQTHATVVIQSGPPQYHGAAPVLVQYGAPPHRAARPCPQHAVAWPGCPVTGSGAANATCG